MKGRPARAYPLHALVGVAFGLAVLGGLSEASGAGPTLSECIAANETSIKLRGENGLREARDQSLACSSPSCPAELREACENRVTQLNLAIPTIVFEVKDAAGNDVTHVTVTMDGKPLVDHIDGTAIALDPGEHTFGFEIDGKSQATKHLVAYQGDLNRRVQIQLGTPAVVIPLISTPPPPLLPRVSVPPAPTSPTASGLGTQKILGLTLGGAGIAGVGVGAVFGILASTVWSRVTSACGAGGSADCVTTASHTSITSDQTTAQTDGTVSTVAFVAGGALVAAGVVLFLTGGHRGEKSSPSAIRLEPSLGVGETRLSLRGSF
jgi:hypothetical protein